MNIRLNPTNYKNEVHVNWKGYVVKHNYVNYDVLMTILENYMFSPLLTIFRLSSRELKVLLYIMCARMMERSLHSGFVA